MNEIAICGGKKLSGEVDVQGSKNAALPILAATILSDEESIIHNCPNLADVRAALEIIRQLGGRAEYKEHTAIVNVDNMQKHEISNELMSSMRSSVLFA